MKPNQEEMLRQIIGDYKFFVNDLLARLAQVGIDVKDYPIDHLCYKVSTLMNYRKTIELLKTHSQGFLETVHHGRPFSKLLLKTPLQVGKYSIPVIEIPAPKPGQIIDDALEHLEIVVGSDYGNVKSLYQHLWTGTVDSGEFNQPFNITFDNGKTVRFHELSITEVIKLEGNSFRAI